jgi:putative transposase
VATISCGTTKEKFRFIERHRDAFGIKRLCNHLNVSRSGYYDWLRRGESKRSRSDKQLLVKIRSIFERSRCIYGSPKVHRELRKTGIFVGKKRVARLMKLAGLRARITRKYPKKPSSRANFHIAENLRLEDKTTQHINSQWSTDLTYLPFGKRWLYLVVVLDLHSRKVVGWSLGESKTTELVKRALKHAIRKRNPDKGLVLHSDRGSEFGSLELKNYTNRYGIIRSMSRPYKSIDNAEIESFFQKLKGEFIEGKVYKTQKELERLIASYINGFYNSVRIHSSLGYLSPLEFEAINA